jgi:hypothetical protein
VPGETDVLANFNPKLPLWIEKPGEVRWRAHSPDQKRFSASWRLWTVKNSRDVYVAQRQLGNQLKVSFHESGKFQTSFLSNEISMEWQGVVPGKTRHLDQWQEPAEFAPGWTRLFEVVHPFTELRAFTESSLAGKQHVTLPVGPGYALHVYILTARLPVVDMNFSSASHFATLVVDDETRVVAVAVIQLWNIGAQLLEPARQRAIAGDPQHLAPAQQTIDPNSPSARLTIHGTHVDGTRFVIDSAGAALK